MVDAGHQERDSNHSRMHVFLYLVPFIISVMSSHGEPDIIVESNIQSATITCTFFSLST